jgi:Asp-tRNA(Asn)/Glu-tRNA(Gln) amidotransferase C subunit
MVDNFLFHKVAEKEKEDIRKQAKKIMDSFSRKLMKVGKISESVIEREVFEREEGDKDKEDFSRDIMFDNAPDKNKDFIIAEKKEW